MEHSPAAQLGGAPAAARSTSRPGRGCAALAAATACSDALADAFARTRMSVRRGSSTAAMGSSWLGRRRRYREEGRCPSVGAGARAFRPESRSGLLASGLLQKCAITATYSDANFVTAWYPQHDLAKQIDAALSARALPSGPAATEVSTWVAKELAKTAA